MGGLETFTIALQPSDSADLLNEQAGNPRHSDLSQALSGFCCLQDSTEVSFSFLYVDVDVASSSHCRFH